MPLATALALLLGPLVHRAAGLARLVVGCWPC
jgi:hypothetical protein